MQTMINLAVMEQLEVPTNSFLGNFGSAGIGVVLLVGTHMIAKNKKWPYDRQPKKFDWKSLLSMAIGMAGITFLLGATGIFAAIPQFFQSTAEGLGSMPIIGDIGMGGICVLMAIYLWVTSFEDTVNLRWGVGCGILFPLGGGIWAQLPIMANNTIVELMSSVTS